MKSPASKPGKDTLIDDVLHAYPMPELWRDLGLPAPTSEDSNGAFETWVPWRENPSTSKRPSLRVFQKGGMWFFKDMGGAGTNKAGTAVHLIAQVMRLDQKASVKELLRLAEKRGIIREGVVTKPKTTRTPARAERIQKPAQPGNLELPREGDLEALSKSRYGLGVDGLKWAVEMGWLRFSTVKGCRAWWVTDKSGWTYQRRRVDNKPWLIFERNRCKTGTRKALSMYGNVQEWPVGVGDIGTKPVVALTEGEPDFLAACDFICRAGLRDLVAPVAFLGKNCHFESTLAKQEGILNHFRGKCVLAFAQHDESGAGLAGARRWMDQLKRTARGTHIVPVQAVASALGVDARDLNELTPQASRLEAWRLFGHFIAKDKTLVDPVKPRMPARPSVNGKPSPTPSEGVARKLVGAYEVVGRPGVPDCGLLVFEGNVERPVTTLYAELVDGDYGRAIFEQARDVGLNGGKVTLQKSSQKGVVEITLDKGSLGNENLPVRLKKDTKREGFWKMLQPARQEKT
jgi:hypothetical protein